MTDCLPRISTRKRIPAPFRRRVIFCSWARRETREPVKGPLNLGYLYTDKAHRRAQDLLRFRPAASGFAGRFDLK